MKIEAQKLKTPVRTLFVNATLLAYEMDIVAHIVILLVNFSTSMLHSNLLSLLAVIGTPKYLKGNPLPGIQ